MKTKCHIVILNRNGEELKRLPTECDGNTWAKVSVKVAGELQELEFEGFPGKPAIKMCMEAIVKVVRKYDPAKHRITVL